MSANGLTNDQLKRLRAVWCLDLATVREEAGMHEFDGQIQDLSTTGVRYALADFGGPALHDPLDEKHLSIFEQSAKTRYGELELHRRNPLLHLQNLDLACYDRNYAPVQERARARSEHLRQWPEAVDMAIDSLDQVPSPVAQALLPAVRGLALGVPAHDPHAPQALTAHAILVRHIEGAAANGPPETALGAPALQGLMTSSEGCPVDLGQLAERADRERTRLKEMLQVAARQLAPGRSSAQVVDELMDEHPEASGVIAAAAGVTEEVIAFCRMRGWLTHLDGVCEVGLAPPSRRWATAMLAWAGPYESDAPSAYDITPPDPSWPEAEQSEWLTMFSETALPAVTAHEVAPGHFAHGRALRRAQSEVQRSLIGAGFAEGWAHYGEELMLEEGFRESDPRFQIGVALEALVRVTRLACAIGLHTGGMTVRDATARFQEDALMPEATARSEANRGTFDPTYGIYTWGKWIINDARDQARALWAHEFSLLRFHSCLLQQGSPPLGLVTDLVRSEATQ